MLQGFRTGKYHGLISWSPDRISRNMKEAGEVIEMIDREDIQDPAFCTYQFDNTPNGKMMLGILFATSKQYSDKLGVDVKRGTDGNIKYVMAGIEWQLRHLTKQSEEAYQMYIDRLESRIASRRAILERKLDQAREDKRSNDKQYAKLLDFQVADPKAYEEHHKGRLDHYKQLSNLAQESIDENKEALEELDTVLPTEQEFYELTKSKLLDLLYEDDIVVLNAICTEFVTNLRAGNDSTPVIKLNPPYDMMVDFSKNTSWSG